MLFAFDISMSVSRIESGKASALVTELLLLLSAMVAESSLSILSASPLLSAIGGSTGAGIGVGNRIGGVSPPSGLHPPS